MEDQVCSNGSDYIYDLFSKIFIFNYFVHMITIGMPGLSGDKGFKGPRGLAR